MLFVGSRHSMFNFFISNKSKMGSQEQKFFKALSYAIGSLDDIGVGTSGGRRNANYFQNA